MIEETVLERRVVVSHKTIRRWSIKFGAGYARRLQRKPARRGDIWHLDEVRIVIGSQIHGLRHIVDQDGYVLDEILQTRHNAKVARSSLRCLLRQQGVRPRPMITAKLKFYGATKRKLGRSV
ncbi:DDE-type integrase/transposase/recombinase [Neokomagataea thailandica]|uniref:DDE-type integrase/transposase/recombinase n=1 Tax=Neokomagataea thailandica TaxID=661190 RepID=UPI001C3F8B14|nr:MULTISPECIES: DDE-type integrase/transposase/recombinase [Neokomagataea]